MRNIYKIFAAFCVCAGLVSCVEYAEYNRVAYASVDTYAKKITESAVDSTGTPAPATVYSLPVHVYNASGDCQVSYEVVDITAKAGLDYEVVGGTGVLNFPKGTQTQEITVSVTGQPGVFTGELKFGINLTGATGGVTIGALSDCVITVADLDHPLVALFGEYEMAGVFCNEGSPAYTTWSFNMTQYDGDVTRVWVDNIVFYATIYPTDFSKTPKIYGIVSDDHKTITFPTPQDTGADASNGWTGLDDYEVYFFRGNQLDFEVEQTPVVFTLQEDGRYTTDADFGFDFIDYYGGIPYYGGSVMSSFSAKYPTYFVKKQ